VGSDGKIRLDMPESASADEIGAFVARIRAPVGRAQRTYSVFTYLGREVVARTAHAADHRAFSLDNLESEGLREDQRHYVTRAREGTSACNPSEWLGAAARVEESIKQAERVNFDLRDLLSSAIAAYRDGFPQAHIELETPADPCAMRGAPDLLVQLLDKLIENARRFLSFHRYDHRALGTGAKQLRAAGTDDGPPIPQALLGRLFESLFEQRQAATTDRTSVWACTSYGWSPSSRRHGLRGQSAGWQRCGISQ